MSGGTCPNGTAAAQDTPARSVGHSPAGERSPACAASSTATDAAVAQMWRDNAMEQRHQGALAVAHLLASLAPLPDGRTVEEAADILWTVVSFESYEALVGVRGWTEDAYARWALASLRATLVAS